MRIRTTIVGSDDDQDVDLRDPGAVAAASDPALALALLRAGFQGPDPVSRRSLIRELCGGIDAPALDSHMRRLAEGFQILEALRYVCPDVVQPQDEFRFITRRGHGVMRAQAPLETIKRDLEYR
jgi:hypothetical protein